MTGAYTLLKTSLLGPSQYNQLLRGIEQIEETASAFISSWAQTKSVQMQQHALELASYCDSVIPRAYLTLLIVKNCKELQKDSIQQHLFDVCRSCLHPLKGIFLLKALLRLLETLPPSASKIDFCLEAYCLGLKLMTRWPQMQPRNAQSIRIEERTLMFELAFAPMLRSIGKICTAEQFTSLVLPTIMTELVNTNDSQLQTLLFDSLYSQVKKRTHHLHLNF